MSLSYDFSCIVEVLIINKNRRSLWESFPVKWKKSAKNTRNLLRTLRLKFFEKIRNSRLSSIIRFLIKKTCTVSVISNIENHITFFLLQSRANFILTGFIMGKYQGSYILKKLYKRSYKPMNFNNHEAKNYMKSKKSIFCPYRSLKKSEVSKFNLAWVPSWKF